MRLLYNFTALFLVLFAGITNSLMAQQTGATCNCKEYIYLNEPILGAVLKFEVGSGTTLTEVVGVNGGTPPNQHWYPGLGVSELPGPHGLATDLNGRLYIGDQPNSPATIRQFDCDGAISPITPTTIVDTYIGPSEFTLFNLFSIGNVIYRTSDNGIRAFDSCTGALIGEKCLSGGLGSFTWGLSYNEKTGTVYASQRLGTVWKMSVEELNDFSTCMQPFISKGPNLIVNPGEKLLPNDNTINGIVGDNSGNIYIVKSGLQDGIGVQSSYILKYNAAGEYISQSPPSLRDGKYGIAIGIVWSETTNKLYVSNNTDEPAVDCISAFDANTMDYLGTAAPNPNLPGDNTAKAIAILKECCPVNLPSAFEKQICGGVGDKFFLNQEAFNECDGTVCGSSWTPTSINGMTFDPCDNSVTITGEGCGVFELNIGAVTSTSCGAQNATFTICNFLPPTVTAVPSACNPLSQTYSVSGSISFSSAPSSGTMTVSVDGGGGSQVFNAPFTSPINYTISNLISDGTGTVHNVTTTYSASNSPCAGGATFTAPCCIDAGDDVTICLPKATLKLKAAPAGNEWVAATGNPAAATIDASTGEITGMTEIGEYEFVLRYSGSPTCSDAIKVTVSANTPHLICNDGSTSVTATAEPGLTNIVWFNSAGAQVGTGRSLIIDSNTAGLADGNEWFYYTAQDAEGCDAELCCPVVIIAQDCCPTPNCLSISVIKN